MDPVTNWNNWLAGQSYLETDYQNTGNPSSSAKGYFQFIDGTAKRATDAGLPDPRAGSYSDQAGAAQAYIRRFHPDAASAIDQGDFSTATHLLRGEWPSLPGGSQQQKPDRYSTWSQILSGQGPRPDQTMMASNVPASSPPAMPGAAPVSAAPQAAAAPGNPFGQIASQIGQQDPLKPAPMMQLSPLGASRIRASMAKGVPFPAPISQALLDVIGGNQQG